MTEPSLSWWDQVQLAFLRWLSFLVLLMDHLFHVRWGEHLIERMAARWQVQLEEVKRNLVRLEGERRQIQTQMDALTLHVAAVSLGERYQARGGLHFDPAEPQDERLLTASIDLLVKQRLAAVSMEEIGPGHYVYHLEPDWGGIRARLAAAAERAEPEIAEWLHEGIRFIEETLRA